MYAILPQKLRIASTAIYQSQGIYEYHDYWIEFLALIGSEINALTHALNLTILDIKMVSTAVNFFLLQRDSQKLAVKIATSMTLKMVISKRKSALLPTD